jgi:hypothetical protein
MTASTLTVEQRQLRERVITSDAPAAETFRNERRDGTPHRDIVAVAEDLGVGEDYR